MSIVIDKYEETANAMAEAADMLANRFRGLAADARTQRHFTPGEREAMGPAEVNVRALRRLRTEAQALRRTLDQHGLGRTMAARALEQF